MRIPAPLLQVEGLAKHYALPRDLLSRQRRVLRAVDGISFSIDPGETLALVGESGCGKSTTARLVLRLLEPTAGRVSFEGTDITALSRQSLRNVPRRIHPVFHAPFSPFNPRLFVRALLQEPLILHHLGDRVQREARVSDVLGQIGLSEHHASRFPHEFSGGQRQRIGVARALMTRPSLLVCDEPVSALDVSIQAQIVNLLMRLQTDLKLTYLFISHDLSVVKHVATRVAVMYLGKIVEIAPKRAFFQDPKFPYSRSLLEAVPRPNPFRDRKARALQGEIPNPIDLPSGCRFHPRCPYVIDRCRKEEPLLLPIVGSPGRLSACHRTHELPPWLDVNPMGSSFSEIAQARIALYGERRRTVSSTS